jgi:hypothetical protein
MRTSPIAGASRARSTPARSPIPRLPGSVTAIAGTWTAEPQDNKPVIRVAAGEALLTANRPASEDDRPLFNPLRIVEANALLQDGVITATGAILLDDRAANWRGSMRGTMSGEGVGLARVNADAHRVRPTAAAV